MFGKPRARGTSTEDSNRTLDDFLDLVPSRFKEKLTEVTRSSGGFMLEEHQQRACAAALTIVQLLPNLFPGNGHAIDLQIGERVEIKNVSDKQNRDRYPLVTLIESCKKCVGNKREITIFINFRNITVATQENEIEFIKDFLRQVYSP